MSVTIKQYSRVECSVIFQSLSQEDQRKIAYCLSSGRDSEREKFIRQVIKNDESNNFMNEFTRQYENNPFGKNLLGDFNTYNLSQSAKIEAENRGTVASVKIRPEFQKRVCED